MFIMIKQTVLFPQAMLVMSILIFLFNNPLIHCVPLDSGINSSNISSSSSSSSINGDDDSDDMTTLTTMMTTESASILTSNITHNAADDDEDHDDNEYHNQTTTGKPTTIVIQPLKLTLSWNQFFCTNYPPISTFFRLFDTIFFELDNQKGNYFMYFLHNRTFSDHVVDNGYLFPMNQFRNKYTFKSIISTSALVNDYFDHLDSLKLDSTLDYDHGHHHHHQDNDNQRQQSKEWIDSSTQFMVRRKKRSDYDKYSYDDDDEQSFNNNGNDDEDDLLNDDLDMDDDLLDEEDLENYRTVPTSPETTTPKIFSQIHNLDLYMNMANYDEEPDSDIWKNERNPNKLFIPIRLWGTLNIPKKGKHAKGRALWKTPIGYEDYLYFPLEQKLVKTHVQTRQARYRKTKFPFVCFVHFPAQGTIGITHRRHQKTITRYLERYASGKKGRQQHFNHQPSDRIRRETDTDDHHADHHHHQQRHQHNRFKSDSNTNGSTTRPFDVDLKIFYTDHDFTGCIELDTVVVLLYDSDRLILIDRKSFQTPFENYRLNASIDRFVETSIKEFLCNKDINGDLDYYFSKKNIVNINKHFFRNHNEVRDDDDDHGKTVYKPRTTMNLGLNITGMVSKSKQYKMNRSLFYIMFTLSALMFIFVFFTVMLLFTKFKKRRQQQQQQQKQTQQHQKQSQNVPEPIQNRKSISKDINVEPSKELGDNPN